MKLPLQAPGGAVRLRRFRDEDLAAFQAYRGDATLGRWQGWRPMADADALAFLRAMAALPGCVPGDWWQIAIADGADDRLIGDIGLHLQADGSALEIGFTLARGAQGRGLATRAVGLAVEAVFEATAAARVIAVTDARNAATLRLLARLAFRPVAALDAVFRGEPCVEHQLVRHRGGRAAPGLRAATPHDAAAVAHLLLASRRELLPFLPAVHSDAETRDWVRGTLLPAGGVTLAELDGTLAGVLATAVREGSGWIEQLYLDPARVGAGIGVALLGHALRTLPRPVRLWTFAANRHARAFYERHGFVAEAFGDGSGNEERCPDVLYLRRAP